MTKKTLPPFSSLGFWRAPLTWAKQNKKKAEKTIQSASGGFGFFSNKEQKYQDAADLYVQAANAFRMQGASQFTYLPSRSFLARCSVMGAS